MNQFSPALEGSTELLEVNWYSPSFVIGAAPSVDRICFFRDPMLPRDVFLGPGGYRCSTSPAYPADPTGERSSPDCLVCEFPVVQREEDRQYSKARAGPREREEGIIPRRTAPHRGGKKPAAVIWKRDPPCFLIVSRVI